MPVSLLLELALTFIHCLETNFMSAITCVNLLIFTGVYAPYLLYDVYIQTLGNKVVFQR